MDLPLKKVYDAIENMACLQPDYISVTYGAGGCAQNNRTAHLSGRILKRHGIQSLAHLTCIGATKLHIEKVLCELQAQSVTNVLALRGDVPEQGVSSNDFLNSQELIHYVKSRGFSVAAAAYPEGHKETIEKEKDFEIMKRKEDAGADYFITQLFFDNDIFYKFLDKAVKKGVKAPVQAGVMPITNMRQIRRIIELSGATLPARFLRIIDRYGCDDRALKDAGIAYATEQIIDLIAFGVSGAHLYTMNDAETACSITQNINSLLRAVNSRSAI